MDPAKLDYFRQRLLTERTRLQTEVQADVSTDVAMPGMASSDHAQWEASGGNSNHLADDATELFFQEEEIAIDNSLHGMVSEIDHALERIANGTYGKCERCGKPIPLPRLEAQPFSALCIEDQAKEEQAMAQHRAGLAARQNIR